MARIVYTLGELRGSIGGLTFQSNSAGKIVRQRPQLSKSSTSRQQSSHQLQQKYLQLWQGLTLIQQSAWNDFATAHRKVDKFGQSKKLTGLNWFESLNISAEQQSLSYMATPPTYTLPSDAPSFEIIATSTSLSIHVTGSIAWDAVNLNIFGTQPTTRSKVTVNQLRKYVGVMRGSDANPFHITNLWQSATGLTWQPLTQFPSAKIVICIQTVSQVSLITSPLLCAVLDTATITPTIDDSPFYYYAS